MADKKVTKKMVLEGIKVAVENGADFGEVSKEDVMSYVETTIAQLDAKAEKSKERASKKKAEGNAFKDAIAAVLTDEFQTIDDIVAKVDFEDATRAKITARLSQLVKDGAAHKTTVSVGDNKRVAYAAGPAPVEEAE